jgi:hypothetical protein
MRNGVVLENRLHDGEFCSQSARGHTQLVHTFRVLSRTRSRFIVKEVADLIAEELADDVAATRLENASAL